MESHKNGWKQELLNLSPILNFYNGEIITYNIEARPFNPFVCKMLDKAIINLNEGDTPILHSLRMAFQMKEYQYALVARGIIQSISRNGNFLDNAVMEYFFDLL